MSHRTLLIGLSLFWVGACAGTESGGGSNTNWLRCTSDRECADGLLCVEQRCISRARAGGAVTNGGSASSGGKGGAPSVGGATSSGGEGGAPSVDGATGNGRTGGVPRVDGATSSGGAADASNRGNPGDAGIDASTDATLFFPCNVTSTTLLARAGSQVDQIAFDGGYLYFHDDSGVSRVPISGGTTVRLATFHTSGRPPEHAFVIDD